MTFDPSPKRIDGRLLAMLVDDPKHMLTLAVASGMAVALELVRRGEQRMLDRLEVDEGVCMRACEAVLEMWSSGARAGGLSDDDFADLCTRIAAIGERVDS